MKVRGSAVLGAAAIVLLIGLVTGSDGWGGPAAAAPSRSVVKEGTRYLRILRGTSHVVCHGAKGRLIDCRLHISEVNAIFAADLTLESVRMPVGMRFFITKCKATRMIAGALPERPCWNVKWALNKWQGGPPSLPNAESGQ